MKADSGGVRDDAILVPYGRMASTGGRTYPNLPNSRTAADSQIIRRGEGRVILIRLASLNPFVSDGVMRVAATRSDTRLEDGLFTLLTTPSPRISRCSRVEILRDIRERRTTETSRAGFRPYGKISAVRKITILNAYAAGTRRPLKPVRTIPVEYT